MIADHAPLRQSPWEVCVIGSGPIGMVLALECERLGQDVLVLESGRVDLDPILTEASQADIVDSRRHAPMDIAVCRAVGGTSWMWGGRCVAFDDIDFEERDYVPYSKWPITHAEIKPWYSYAAKYLLCGNDEGRLDSVRDYGQEITADFIERWSTCPKLALIHRQKIEASQHIILCTDHTVVDLNLNESGTCVEGISVSTPHGKSVIQAKTIIIAAGGVESTRLLLSVQRSWPEHFGGTGGVLGRYYMGHLSGKIASICFDNPTDAKEFDFVLDSTGTYVRRRLMLTEDTQRSERLLNTAFWPDNPPFYDPTHQSGALSAVFLALVCPPIGRKMLPEAIRLAHIGHDQSRISAHLLNILKDAPAASKDIFNILRDRFMRRPRKPGFMIYNRNGKYALHYHAEQEPHPDSRIALSESADQFNVPRVSVDLRFTEKDVESVIRSHEILDIAIRKAGIGKLEYWYPLEQLADRVLAQATDGIHQVGTTKMGTDPNESVVNADLRIHGINNLYVAATSVLPTTGQANPTMLGAALAARLVHHIVRERAYVGEVSLRETNR